MAKIKEEDIEALRDKADTVEVISAYSTLKKSGGTTYKGLCPFHSEKTPSFTVDVSKGLWHCLAGETGVITWRGTVPISKLAGETHRLLTTNGVWVDGLVRSYGTQRLWAVHLTRNRRKKVIYATDGHRWLVRQGAKRKERVTTELKPGDPLAYSFPRTGGLMHAGPTPFGIAHGFTYGDGVRTPHGCMATFDGDKDLQLLKFFPAAEVWTKGRIRVGRLPLFFKDLPSLDEAPAYLLGWLAGYFAADGCVSKDQQVTMASASKENLEFVRVVANRLGIGTYGIKQQSRLGYGAAPSDLFSVTFINSTLSPNFFVLEHHRRRFEEVEASKRLERRGWIVREVRETDRFEEVYCAEVPGTHAFALEDNILTGNCFGCGKGGNIYHFVQEMESLPFPEAVEWLARKFSFELHYEESRPGEARLSGIKARVIEANEAAAAFFHQTLVSSPEAAQARQYLQSRGFGKEVAERWQLGYSPGRDALCQHLFKKGFKQPEIEQADLARVSDRDRRLYDFFRQRIMFPTWNLQGDVIAFGARALGDQQPKYLNTSETPAFAKSRAMYGLNRAKSSISRGGVAIVVEGYTDVIALHEAGITEAVATNGTALGESHFELLKKFADRAILMFDADEAGKGATERGFGIHHRIGLEVLVAPLPAGRDPADVVTEDGPEGIRKVIEGGQSLLEFKLEQTIAKLPLDTPEARSHAVREAVEVLRLHPDPIARHEYVFMVASRVGVDADVVQRAVTERRGPSESGGPAREKDRRLPGHVKVEREALLLLLTHTPETRDWVDGVEETNFTSPARRELFRSARAIIIEGADPASLTDRLSPEALPLFTEITVGGEVLPVDELRPRIREVFTRLKVFPLERDIKTRRDALHKVNPVEDPQKHDELFTDLVQLEARRRDLLRRVEEDD